MQGDVTMFGWPSRARAASRQRTEAVAEQVSLPSKATIEANIAEIRAKRGQIVLNSILEDVISAGVSPLPQPEGGGRDGA